MREMGWIKIEEPWARMMLFKNTHDYANRIRDALDHLDEVRMPKESRECLKELRSAASLLLVHATKETLAAHAAGKLPAGEIEKLAHLITGSDVQSPG